MFCVGNTLQRLYIGKIGVIHNDTNTFSCVNRRTSAQCDDEVGSGCFESSHTVLYVSNGWICLYIAVKFVRNFGIIQNLDHFGSNTKFNQVLIGYKKGFLESATSCFRSNHRATACSKIRGFV
ncbi:hypothetical protein SDC9_190111 [bioreactor metagenome]|uniref:Uncharacterized protein n=1 Tax=bioreactor metagenome TaxID=1076179 RepID=A0A645I259_9ZZZZ